MLHQVIDQRSLELDKAVLDKIRQNPALLDIPRSNISRWLKMRDSHPLDPIQEWKHIFDNSTFEEILSWLERDDDEAARLRQSSPFVGILSEQERMNIFRKYEAFRN